MSKRINIIPITDLRQDATAILKQIAKYKTTVVVTQRGRASVVIVSIEEYEQSQHELELLKLLAQREKEIETGKGYELDIVLSQADVLLKELQK